MRIFCRKDFQIYLEEQSSNIFEYSKRGIEYYESVFNVDYPFSKLDSIFCPEFTVGAMEYPGAITYTENIVPKGPNTTHAISLRGIYILHELAHMWFGNTVTMKWWDGLWLNESFAELVSFKAWKAIKSKLTFETYEPFLMFLNDKQWGYKEDQEPTTHAIAGDVVNTEIAENIFDGITYSKGSSVVYQLINLVGEERFRAAMSNYFQSHKFWNTGLEDLLKEYQAEVEDLKEQHKAFDIEQWKKDWLLAPGLNTVQAEWSSGQAGPQKLILRQGVCLRDFPTLRYHKINLSFFNSKGDEILVKELILENQETTEVEVDLPEEFEAVLPNSKDFSFIKILFDKKSENYFLNNFLQIENSIRKGVVLMALLNAVIDARLKASKFADLCLLLIEQEENNQILDMVYKRCLSEVLYILHGDKHKEYSHKIFQASKKRLLRVQDLMLKRSISEKLFQFAEQHQDVEVGRLWYLGQAEEMKNVELTLKIKSVIVFKVNAIEEFSKEQGEEVLEKLLGEDQSDTVEKLKLKVDGATASSEERNQLFEKYWDEKQKWSYTLMSESMRGFNSHFVSKDKRFEHADEFYNRILPAMRSRTREFAEVYIF